jgi:hypothetical protein
VIPEDRETGESGDVSESHDIDSIIGRCLRAAGGITGIRVGDINDKYK